MVRSLAALLVVTAIIGLAPAAPVPKHLMPKAVPVTFPTRAGTTWVYDYGSFDVTITISDVKKKAGATLVRADMVDSSGRFPAMTLSVREQGLFIVSTWNADWDEPLCAIKFPHREGETWQTRQRMPNYDYTETRRAGPTEKVRVPAGEFEAVRVDWERKGTKVTKQGSDWYVPGIGLIQTDNDFKLKSFTPGKG